MHTYSTTERKKMYNKFDQCLYFQSKKKGLSVEEKRNRMMDFFYEKVTLKLYLTGCSNIGSLSIDWTKTTIMKCQIDFTLIQYMDGSHP